MPAAYRLLSPRPMASRVLLLFPFAGAGASVFREWSAHLPDDIEPWALQLPGREDRLEEDCLTEWNEALTTTVEECEVMAAGRPLHFYGHSLGALMA
ncbi:MAG: thioesterase domain-containing protein, partial [Pseudomonadota bacterium]